MRVMVYPSCLRRMMVHSSSLNSGRSETSWGERIDTSSQTISVVMLSFKRGPSSVKRYPLDVQYV